MILPTKEKIKLSLRYSCKNKSRKPQIPSVLRGCMVSVLQYNIGSDSELRFPTGAPISVSTEL